MATQVTRHQMEFTGADAVVNGWRQIAAAARASLRQTQEEAQRVPPHLKAINASMVELRASAAAAASRLGPAGAALAAFGPAGAAAGVAVAGVAAGLTKATLAAADFQKSASQLKAITGVAGRDFDFLTAKAIEFGRTTTLSATAALDAFRLIGSRRPELLQSAAALAEVTAQARILAEASGQELQVAAVQLANALNQTNASASEAAKFINVIAAASLKGAAELPEFNEALLRVGTTATDAGVGIEQLSATLQLLLKFGQGAEITGTGLRNVFAKLAQGASDTNPAVVGLATALDNLQKKLDSGVNIFDLFDDRTAVTAKQLLLVRQQIDPFAASITGTNTATEQAAINVDNLRGDLDKLAAAFGTLSVEIGNTNQGPARGFIQFLTDALSGVGRLLSQPGLGVALSGGPQGVRGAYPDREWTAAVSTLPQPFTPADPAGFSRAQADQLAELGAVVDRQQEQRRINAQNRLDQIILANRSALEKLDKDHADLMAEIAAREAEGLVTHEQATKAKTAAEKKYNDERATLTRATTDKIASEQKKATTEYARQLDAIAKLERDAAQAGLDGVELLAVKRDQALADYKGLLDERKIADADYQRAAVAIEAKFQGEKGEIARREQERANDEALRELEQFQQEQARQLAAPLEQAARDIQEVGGAAFASLWGESVDGAEDAADAVKRVWTRMLGELAQLALGRIVIGPVLNSLGLGGIATATGTQNAGGLNLGQVVTGLFGGGAGTSGTLGALFGAGGATYSAVQQGRSGGGFSTVDALGYFGTLNQAANTAGYGFSLSGNQGAGLYFNSSPLYTFGASGGAALGGYSASALASLGALPAEIGAGINGVTPLFGNSGQLIGLVGGEFGAGVSIAPEFASQYAANYAVSGTTPAGSTLGSVASSLSTVLAAAGLAYSLYNAGQGIADFRGQYDDVTRGTAGGRRDAFTGVQAGLIAGFTAGGAALGSIVPGIGTIVGAGVGAAVGSALTSALGGAVVGGVGSGTRDGITQAQLNRRVDRSLRTDPTLQIIDWLLNPFSALGPYVGIGSLGQLIGGAFVPDIEDIYDKILQEVVEPSIGRPFNRQLGDYVGQGPLRREGLSRFLPGGEDRDEAQFFTRLIASGIGAGNNPERTDRFYRQFVNNLGGANRSPDAIFEDFRNIIRDLVPLMRSLRFTNAEYLAPGTTQLRPGETQAEYVERSTSVVEAYLGRRGLPPNFDVEAVVRRVLAEQGFLSRGAIARAAGLSIRDEAEATGRLQIDPSSVSTRNPRVVSRRLRGGGRKRRERRQGLQEGQAVGLDAVDALTRSLRVLANPAEAITLRFGDIQTALNQINALPPSQLDQLPELMQNAVQAVEAWGQAITSQLDRIRQLDAQIEASPLQYGEQIDALTRATTTHLRYNDVLAASEDRVARLAAENASASAQVGALTHHLDLLGAQANARITDIQEGAAVRLEAIQDRAIAISDRGEAISPLAQLSAGLTDQLTALRQQGTLANPLLELTQLARDLRVARRDYRGSTGEDQAEAAAEIQRIIARQLELAGATFGAGSGAYANLRGSAIRTLRPIEATARSYEEESRDLAKEQRDLAKEQREIERETRDAIRAVQAELAAQIEIYSDQIGPLLVQQRDEEVKALREALPDLTDEQFERILADPMAAQLFVANLQLERLEAINDGVADLVRISEGRGALRNEGGIDIASQRGGLETAAASGPNGTTLFYGQRGGAFEDLDFARVGTEWTKVKPGLWAMDDTEERKVLVWLGSNPPGPAGGPGKSGREGVAIPYLETGGTVMRDGIAYLHAREEVMPVAEVRRSQSAPSAPPVQVTVAPGAVVIQVPPGTTRQQARLLFHDAADVLGSKIDEHIERAMALRYRKAG
jgi:TP901 family phage tail tape measure protein